MKMITPREMDHVDHKVSEDIKRTGWSDIGVFSNHVEDDLPFNYTVGMAECDHPDFVIVGMSNPQAHSVLGVVVHWVMHDGRRYQADELYDEIVMDYQVGFVKVDDPLAEPCPMNMTQRLYGFVDALQLVWPDADGRFPWHPECSKRVQSTQPLLGTWNGP